MSEPMRIGIICEGKTDYIVIKAAIDALLNIEFRSTLLQPDTSVAGDHLGQHGGGWKGVRSYCNDFARISRIDNSSIMQADIIIIHIDADIACDPEINCEKPCPPPEATVLELHRVVLSWMDKSERPRTIVFCIPSKDIEAWVFVALFPKDSFSNENLECRNKPESLLVGKKYNGLKLVKKSGNSYQKNKYNYQSVSSAITKNWSHVKDICTEAKRFSSSFIEATQ